MSKELEELLRKIASIRTGYSPVDAEEVLSAVEEQVDAILDYLREKEGA